MPSFPEGQDPLDPPGTNPGRMLWILTTSVLTAAIWVGLAASNIAFAEERWGNKACQIFTNSRRANICTLQAVTSFAPLTTESASVIAEQSVKSCDWAWRDVYDQEGHLGSFRQFLQTIAAEWVILVLESRLPPGNPQPQTRMQTDIIMTYTVKLLKDCGAIR